jgi:hypothetical protein
MSGSPRRAFLILLISYGCGTTARALTQVPGVEHIDVVDISREILDASAIVHPPDGTRWTIRGYAFTSRTAASSCWRPRSGTT